MGTPAPSDEPLPQLDHAFVQHIAKVLIEAGGALPLGKLTTQFAGVKKAQLEPHVAVSAHPRSQTRPPSEIDQVNVISAFLQLHGGCVKLGKLCTHFAGVKKVQLQPLFVIAGDPAVDMSVCIDLDTATAHRLVPVPPEGDTAALS